MDAAELLYGTYWERKRLINQGVPIFPIIRHYLSTPDALSRRRGKFVTDLQMITDHVRDASSLLDVGAGDLRVKGLVLEGGFRGEYHTQDIGKEYDHTYQSLDEVDREYPAIICLDVLEHLTLVDGLAMLHRLRELLEPGGVLVIQTPNALCMRDPMAWDMTHVQCYNGGDLWAYLQALGLNVQGYRILLPAPPQTLRHHVKERLQEFLARLMRADHADNLLMFARKPAVAG